MKLIVGLGNPGRKYAGNRHNIGFMCLDFLARQYKIKLDRRQGKAHTGTGEIDGNQVVLARPQTFMNLSGQSVRSLREKYKPEEIIVVHDDLDLPPGKIRIRYDGGSGGHKGIKSIVNELGSPDFIRVRIGIGRPDCTESETDIIDYVLSDFSGEERRVISQVIPLACEAMVSILNEGLETAMNRYN